MAKSKSEVKSFLQTMQFCPRYIIPGGGKGYADVTAPLRRLTNKSTCFEWSKDCGRSFEKLKDILSSESVLASHAVGRKTRLYVDHGSQGVTATAAQLHAAQSMDASRALRQGANENRAGLFKGGRRVIGDHKRSQEAQEVSLWHPV